MPSPTAATLHAIHYLRRCVLNPNPSPNPDPDPNPNANPDPNPQPHPNPNLNPTLHYLRSSVGEIHSAALAEATEEQRGEAAAGTAGAAGAALRARLLTPPLLGGDALSPNPNPNPNPSPSPSPNPNPNPNPNQVMR